MAAEAARSEMDDETKASEADLVAAALTHPSAFAPLYRRHVDEIYRFCFRRLGTREDAEDATSHVFAKALTSLGGFRGGPVRSWLFAIADRHTLDRLRGRRPNTPSMMLKTCHTPGSHPRQPCWPLTPGCGCDGDLTV